MKPLIIQLVTWNGEKYIPYLFESLRKQRFTDFELWILDNGSSDATVACIKKELTTISQPTRLICKEKNCGFAVGHNELFRESVGQASYVLLLNQDMMLDPFFIEKLFYFGESHPDAGSMSGRLMKWAFPEKTTIIDSIGLRAFANHRVIDAKGGEAWESADDDMEAIEVFGVSGALPLYRSAALEAVMERNHVFDEDFFSYKEDVDLAWRLRAAGWTAFSVLDAVAYHDRSASGPKGLTDAAAIDNRKNKSELSKFYSYRNHLLMLIKNSAHEGSVVRTLWYESKKAVYLAIFATRTFAQCWVDVIRLLPRMQEKRQFIRKNRKILDAEMNEWFV